MSYLLYRVAQREGVGVHQERDQALFLQQRVLHTMRKEDVYRCMSRSDTNAATMLSTNQHSPCEAALDDRGGFTVQGQVRGMVHTEAVLLPNTSLFGLHTK